MKATITPALTSYLGCIAKLQRNKHVVRVRDIAIAKKVAVPSVCSAMSRLEKLGFIVRRQGECIVLTDAGQAEAKGLEIKQQALRKLFSMIVGAPIEYAKRDSIKLAPLISDRTSREIVSFLQGRS